MTLGGQRTWSVAFSPNGKHIASVNFAGVVQVWDILKRTPLATFTNHSTFTTNRPRYTVYSSPLAYSPDGKRLAVEIAPAVLSVLDATTGEEQLKISGHSGYATHVAFSPDGKRLASTSTDGTIKLWDTQTGL